MNHRPIPSASRPPLSTQPSVVVIGSYREDLSGLLALSASLTQLGVTVLHPPAQARAVGEESGFVHLDCDQSPHPAQIQRHVFSLIDRADAVILYAPSGRVGLSAAMEVGYALRAHKRILSTAPPQDLTLRTLIDYRPSALRRFLKTVTTTPPANEHESVSIH